MVVPEFWCGDGHIGCKIRARELSSLAGSEGKMYLLLTIQSVTQIKAS